MIEVKRLISSVPNNHVYHLARITSKRFPGDAKVLLVNDKNDAYMTCTEFDRNGSCELLVPSSMHPSSIKNVVITDSPYIKHNMSSSVTETIVFDNNIELPMIASSSSIEQGVKVYDIAVSRNYNESSVNTLESYNAFKENILIVSLNMTVLGTLAIFAMGFPFPAITFMFGGLCNQIYQILLINDVDNLGKDKMFTNTFPLRILMFTAAFSIVSVQVVSQQQSTLSLILSFMIGFSMGKLSLILESIKKLP